MLAFSDPATSSSTTYDSGLSADRPVSKVTPLSTSGARAVVKRMTHPCASTLVPAGVSGHLSLLSSTPSPSESRESWHPDVSTSVPAGVLGHLSSPS